MTETTEAALRLGCFSGVLLIMTMWELTDPRRPLNVRKSVRWSSNLGLVVLNIVLARLLIPLTAVGAATMAQANGWGLLHWVAWPAGIELIVAVLAFDLAIYFQHVLFHAVPALWRLHIVHHADLDFDVTTGLRFHTLEILLSALIKIAAVFVIGPSAVAVVVFEVLLNASSMFNHSNISLPSWLETPVRWFIVTPDMHRVHHSVIRREANSNFGFNLSWWDFLLGTYLAAPKEGQLGMTIGVAHLRDERQADQLPSMLAMPFVRLPDDLKVQEIEQPLP